MKGQIERLNSTKGYGFIRAGNKDYFFHKSSFEGHWEDLVEDMNNNIKPEVEFEDGPSLKGPRAEKVKRLDWPNQST